MTTPIRSALLLLVFACSTDPAPPETVVVDVFHQDPITPIRVDQPVRVETVALSPVDEAPPVEPEGSPAPVEPMGPPTTTWELRRGETLAHFARWSGLPVEEVAAQSHLPLDGTYAVGTEVALAVDPEVRSTIETKRDAHHRARVTAYLSSRNSSATTFYSVRTGDSAWTIARRDHGMPVWLLESLNPSADLDRLRPGQDLMVPVFQDIVASAPSDEEERAEREVLDLGMLRE